MSLVKPLQVNALSKTGKRILANAERVIEDGLANFLKVGTALAEIRDGRLYREEYESFEAYCRGRWGFGARRARQLMDAAEIGTIVPVDNEGQARALSPLANDPAAMQAAYDEAESEGPVTARSLAKAVSRRTSTETTETTFDPETGEIVDEIGEPDSNASDAPAGQTEAGGPAPSAPPPKDPRLTLLADLASQRARAAQWLAFDRHDEAIDLMDAEQRADYRSFLLSVHQHVSAAIDHIDARKLKAVR